MARPCSTKVTDPGGEDDDDDDEEEVGSTTGAVATGNVMRINSIISFRPARCCSNRRSANNRMVGEGRSRPQRLNAVTIGRISARASMRMVSGDFEEEEDDAAEAADAFEEALRVSQIRAIAPEVCMTETMLWKMGSTLANTGETGRERGEGCAASDEDDGVVVAEDGVDEGNG